MPNPSKRSIEALASEDYISKTLAATQLQEILNDEALEEEIKNRILEKYASLLEERSHSRYVVQDLSLAVFSSIKEIEIIVSEGVKIDFYEVTNDLIEPVELEGEPNEEIVPQFGLLSSELEPQATVRRMKQTWTFRTEKCQNPNDPNCIGIRSLRISL